MPTLKKNLQAILAARTALSGVRVSYGVPWPSPPREFIALGGVDGEQHAAAIGRQRREENYELEFFVHVVQEGQDQQAATERAFALLAEVENAARADPTVNGALGANGWAEVGGRLVLEELVSTQGMSRGAQITARLQCKQRI